MPALLRKIPIALKDSNRSETLGSAHQQDCNDEAGKHLNCSITNANLLQKVVAQLLRRHATHVFKFVLLRDVRSDDSANEAYQQDDGKEQFTRHVQHGDRF